MKNAKLLVAVLAGFSISLIFGFTKAGSGMKARKHVSIVLYNHVSIRILLSPTDIKEISTRKMSNDEMFLEINKSMSELEEKGYELVSTESHGAGNSLSIVEYLFREK